MHNVRCLEAQTMDPLGLCQQGGDRRMEIELVLSILLKQQWNLSKTDRPLTYTLHSS